MNESQRMKTNLQTYIIQFDAKASHIYKDIYDQFLMSVNHTDRNANENIYQMQGAKYLSLLTSHLSQLASQLLERNQTHPLQSRLHSLLTEKISYYTQEFRHKIASG